MVESDALKAGSDGGAAAFVHPPNAEGSSRPEGAFEPGQALDRPPVLSDHVVDGLVDHELALVDGESASHREFAADLSHEAIAPRHERVRDLLRAPARGARP